MNELESLIKKCKKDITYKLLGSEKFELSYSQLHKLSDEIFKVTNISISHSTLKRIFKVDYSSSPQLTTLDAFAKYLDYTDWNDYFKKNINNKKIQVGTKNKSKKKLKNLLFLIGGFIGFCTLVFISYKNDFYFKQNYDNIEFSYYIYDTNSMPLVVGFRYNLKNINCKEANIQPISTYGMPNPDKIQLNLDDTTTRYIYQWYSNYTPLLEVDGKIVKQLQLNFETQVWKAFISNERAGYYIKHFDDKEIYSNGKMAFTDNVLKCNNFLKTDIDDTGYCLYKDFDGITGDSLHFETQIRNTLLTRNENTGDIGIVLLFENCPIFLPLMPMKNPFYEFYFLPFENPLSSQKTDLSFLYLNPEQWNTIKIVTHKKNFELLINNSTKFKTQYKADPGKLIGLLFQFSGMGQVEYIKFYNTDNELIYNDEFE